VSHAKVGGLHHFDHFEISLVSGAAQQCCCGAACNEHSAHEYEEPGCREKGSGVVANSPNLSTTGTTGSLASVAARS
jgi:hypothetical protein